MKLEKHKMHLFNTKTKTWERYIYWAVIYSIKSPLASITVNEQGARTTMSIYVNGSEYLSNGGHRTGLDPIEMWVSPAIGGCLFATDS